MDYSYEINPRPVELGGGWRLRLLEGGEEVGGGAFAVEEVNPRQGMDWWNLLQEPERAHWLAVAGSAVPAEAWAAYLLGQAHAKAEASAYAWLDTRIP
jgi:hypothetical protein